MNKARLIGCSLPSVIAGAAAFSVMVATVAFAATGDVTPAGCVSDLGSSECTHTTEGLNHPYDIAISPDGTSVYVAALDDDALVMFTRTSTGQIFPAGCIADDQGPDICDGKMAPGLNGARSVVVSPRGDMVYVVGADDATIDRFSRDLSTGQLTFEECIQDTEVEISQHDCTVTSDGLEGARQVAISPDGNSAYVASLTDDAIAEFETSGGTLSYLGCIDDNDTGKDPCKPSIDGL